MVMQMRLAETYFAWRRDDATKKTFLGVVEGMTPAAAAIRAAEQYGYARPVEVRAWKDSRPLAVR